MEDYENKYIALSNKLVIIGFGSIGQAILPLLFRHLKLTPSQIIIITKDEQGAQVAKEFGLFLEIMALTPENYLPFLMNILSEGDFLLNLSVDVSSVSLIKLCQDKGILYLDASTEPWKGGYVDKTLSPSSRSNYALRTEVLKLKKHQAPTAVITHGANPGLVSHFVKQALWNLANDEQLLMPHPSTAEEWALLAKTLGIKVIHIAEHDTQITPRPKLANEFVNTWSAHGFIAEGSQPAELSWGSHERHWPKDAHHHEFGSKSAIYLNRPGASTRVRSWTPGLGSYHGYLITHAEAISIGSYLTLTNKDDLYRPTVHYAYLPCPDAILSLLELQGSEWCEQEEKRLIFSEILEGIDELGVLLMGHTRGAYWYGSQLSIHEARQLVPHNNATSLQVASGVLAGLIWAIKNPQKGVVEPEELDYQFILEIARPYLGKVKGYYTDWNPLRNREKLFKENLDLADPWQFLNLRVE
ncbi:homospermidine synthase [Legionella hackeliae]|uniref:Homospermidine synthase n=1 Tax=Legionella hackeliae TaxID=449 RepID=A0A0A8UR00_LEGHA|nr:saccharopine dehydrogenase C-terminal domain-containing protein [Legionella hackeliae]KTD14857.1 homospermidine synthase [Legionella hackeliae]CEK09517.1 Homospermidine synthase [Legionella hackeliae]STX49424.1 homospermidine synthase [Legionella hackeliae]